MILHQVRWCFPSCCLSPLRTATQTGYQTRVNLLSEARRIDIVQMRRNAISEPTPAPYMQVTRLAKAPPSTGSRMWGAWSFMCTSSGGERLSSETHSGHSSRNARSAVEPKGRAALAFSLLGR